jgi:zinc/manganese transport system permease protein
MFEYDLMQNAFAAAIVAIVSGVVGYFLVLRGQTFAGHALALLVLQAPRARF